MGTQSRTSINRHCGSLGSLLAELRSIRLRLYAAFGIVASMTVVGSLFALYHYSSLGATMTSIVSQSMPATIGSLHLSEQASILVASAPRLMSAEDDNRRAKIADEIEAQTQALYSTIEYLRGLDPKDSVPIDDALTPLNNRLTTLNDAVTERIKISLQRRTLAILVDKLRESILEALTPAIAEVNFDLMTRDRTPEHEQLLNGSIDAFRHLLQMQARVNRKRCFQAAALRGCCLA